MKRNSYHNRYTIFAFVVTAESLREGMNKKETERRGGEEEGR